jgi:hypothetical protein
LFHPFWTMLGLDVMAEAQPYLIIRSESERAA